MNICFTMDTYSARDMPPGTIFCFALSSSLADAPSLSAMAGSRLDLLPFARSVVRRLERCLRRSRVLAVCVDTVVVVAVTVVSVPVSVLL